MSTRRFMRAHRSHRAPCREADRSVPGLAQFISREFCREAEAAGYEFINTLDDSGLPSLARSKHAYHPVRLVASYMATEH